MVKKIATSFTLHSVDHDRVLLDSESLHNTRQLLGDDAETPKQLKLSFTVDGETKESILYRSRGAFGEGATMTFAKKDSSDKVEVPDVYAYYSEDKNWVMTFHNDQKFSGLVYENNNNDIYNFVAENGKMKINGDVRDYFPGDMKSTDRNLLSVAETAANGIDYWDDCHPAQADGMSRMDIGLVSGVLFYNIFGDNTVSEMNNYIVLSNSIYERQMDVSLSVQDVFVATEGGIESFLPSRCSMSIQNQLSGMARWRKPTNQVLWHLLDGCFGSSGGILGIAYLGTLCSNNNVGVSYYSDDRYDDDEYPTWATVAHELGHNFDGQHSFEEGQGRTGGIMDYGFLKDRLINGEIQFNSQYREREVCREVSSAVSRNCLVRGVGPSSQGEFIRTTETEVFAPRERDLKCRRHVHKMPDTGAHLKKFSSKTRVQCQKECAERENCEGFVFNREGWCELLSEIDTERLLHTSEFSTFVCSENEDSLVQPRSEDDLLAEANVEGLKDSCCANFENEGFLGMNMNYRENLSLAECEAECVQNSRCEAVTYNAAETSCMLFGGKDFSHKMTSYPGAVTLSCERSCLSAAVVSSEASSVDASKVAGSLAVVGGLVALVVGTVLYRRRKTSGNAEEAAVYQATL